jgi:hypothetical protein
MRSNVVCFKAINIPFLTHRVWQQIPFFRPRNRTHRIYYRPAWAITSSKHLIQCLLYSGSVWVQFSKFYSLQICKHVSNWWLLLTSARQHTLLQNTLYPRLQHSPTFSFCINIQHFVKPIKFARATCHCVERCLICATTFVVPFLDMCNGVFPNTFPVILASKNK